MIIMMICVMTHMFNICIHFVCNQRVSRSVCMAYHGRLACPFPQDIDRIYSCASWKLNIRKLRPLYGLFMDPNTKKYYHFVTIMEPPSTISGRLTRPEQSFISIINPSGPLFKPAGRRRHPDLSQHDPREGRFTASDNPYVQVSRSYGPPRPFDVLCASGY